MQEIISQDQTTICEKSATDSNQRKKCLMGYCKENQTKRIAVNVSNLSAENVRWTFLYKKCGEKSHFHIIITHLHMYVCILLFPF